MQLCGPCRRCCRSRCKRWYRNAPTFLVSMQCRDDDGVDDRAERNKFLGGLYLCQSRPEIAERLEQAVFAGEFYAQMFVGEAGGYAAAGGAVQEADLDEERFVDLFQRVLLFGKGGGQRV